MSTPLTVTIQQGDIAAYPCDVVALKYAQAFYGADRAIAQLLVVAGKPQRDFEPSVGAHCLVDSTGVTAARHVLFVGVPHLTTFRYADIRVFAQRVLQSLAEVAPNTQHIAMTIHGVGAGLDETESLLAQLAGYHDALRNGSVPPRLERITILERSEDRVQRLQAALSTNLGTLAGAKLVSSGTIQFATAQPQTANQSVGNAPGSSAKTKPHAFVAMSYSTEMEDVYYYGIQAAVHTCGLLCERTDHSAFVGDIVDQMCHQIETASVVVAELTGSNPNVCLEVGYAWGKARPTILIARSVDDLFFDVKGHKCISYEGIRDLEAKLTAELRALRDQGIIQGTFGSS